MKVVNIYGPIQSGKTVISKVIVDKLIEDLGIKVLVLSNSLTDGEKYVYSLSKSNNSNVDILRPFMLSGLITKEQLNDVKITMSNKLDVIRGSEISEIDVAQVEIILGLLDGYEVIIIESRKPFISKKYDVLNVSILAPIEEQIKEAFKTFDENTVYVLNKYDHEVLGFKPKKFDTIDIPTESTFNLVANGYKYKLPEDCDEAIESIIDNIDGLDELEIQVEKADKKSFLSKMRIIGR